MEQSSAKHLTQDSVDKFTSKNKIKGGRDHVNNVTNITRHYVHMREQYNTVMCLQCVAFVAWIRYTV